MSKRIISFVIVFAMSFSVFSYDITYSAENNGLVSGKVAPMEGVTNTGETGTTIVDDSNLDDGDISVDEPKELKPYPADVSIITPKAVEKSAVTTFSTKTDYYVSNSGSNISGEGTYANPYKTIQWAINDIKADPAITATDGAMIYVMGDTANGIGGTYTMSEVAQESDFPGPGDDDPKKITITSTNKGYGGEPAVPANNRVVVQRDSSFTNQMMFKVSNLDSTMILQDIIIDGNNVVTAPHVTGAFDVVDGTMKLNNVLVQNHDVSKYNTRIFVAIGTDSHIVVENSEIINNHGDNVDDYGDPANIDGNIFTLDDGSTLDIENTKIVNNSVNNIVDSWTNETINVKNSAIYDNSGIRNIFELTNSNLTIENTRIYNNTVDNIVKMEGSAVVNLKNGTDIQNNPVAGYAMTGIRDNTPNGTIKMQDKVIVNNNNSGAGPHNVFLDTGDSIKLTGALLPGSSIGISQQSPPNSKINDSVIIAEKAAPAPSYVPVQSDEAYFVHDVATGLQIKWRDSTPSGDGKIYSEFIWNASPPIITAQSTVGYTENTGYYITGDQISVTATAPAGEPAPINGVISYQWYSNTLNSNIGGTIAPGVSTNRTYSVPNPVGNTVDSKLYYYCVVTNTNTNATGTVTADVVSSPVLIKIVPLVGVLMPPMITISGTTTGTTTVTEPDGIDGNGINIDNTGSPDEAIIDDNYLEIAADAIPFGAVVINSGVSRYLNTTDHFAYLVGYNDDSFGPDNNMTRAEVAQMFYSLLLDKNPGEEAVEYSDVPADAWYAEAVNTLSSKGIITGYPDGSFKPNEPVTRAEFVTIASGFAYEKSNAEGFTDVTAEHWAYNEIMTAASHRFVTGYDDGTFRPDQLITRAEAATCVNAMLDRQADTNFIEENGIENFPDVAQSHWAYYEIMEATINHDYKITNATEIWSKYE